MTARQAISYKIELIQRAEAARRRWLALSCSANAPHSIANYGV